MFDKDNYSRLLKEQRKKLNLTQTDLSKKVGVSRNYLSDIENRKASPSFDLLIKLNKVIPIIFLEEKSTNSEL